MKLVIIIVVGLAVFVGLAALVGTFLVGLSEAADPEQTPLEDLSEVERSLVDRDDEPEEGARS